MKNSETTNIKNNPGNDNKDQKNKKEKAIEHKKEIQKKFDSIQILLVVTILVFLVVSTYLILGPLSMIAMGMGGILLIYHLISAQSKAYSKNKTGNRGPSVFLLFLLTSPFIIGAIIAYEGYSLLESPVRIILLWAMTITFWSTMLFVPMAVFSKHREEIQPELQFYPTVSVIIPAYNEEKVIAHTIEALIETKYPKKEIIFVDDGSTDKTLDIAMQYKDKIKVLHKENGGKASALNYGLVYSKGEIIVIVDADTIIGRNSLKEMMKGFQINEHVAAVAGNIKVRNRVNAITKCQALEYITGIQIVRRAFDIFGSITIVPGALGAFRKSFLTEAGAYGKDTIVEDFDQTIKLLKAGLITQGSTKATAYTEAPNTLHDFISQRKRWYRGNIQVLKRHGDALTNPRYGYLQRLSFPYLVLGMLVTPIIGFVATFNAILGVIQGDGLYVLQVMTIFTIVHYLMSALAIRIDNEDPKLLWYAGLLVFGFKQIVDFLLLKAIIEQISNKKANLDKCKEDRSLKNFNILKIAIIVLVLSLVIPINLVYSQESKTIQVEVKYTNGDRADFYGMSLVIYQDNNNTPFLKKEMEGNPDSVTLPKDHTYKIEVYANGMYGDVGYLNLKTEQEKINISIPLSGGIQFNVFYNDGKTPVKNALVAIKSYDGTQLRIGKTNDQGDTMRYWIQSTTKNSDYYVADVYLGEIQLTSLKQIKLLPGLTKDQKIIVPIPATVQDLITVSLYKTESEKITKNDGEFSILLKDSLGNIIKKSQTNNRGEAYFSNLPSNEYFLS
ncbi:glycosyltransferase family 2 protein, partial [Candidatus Nitrosarchaeum limnium]|uniref:glycosyltransferase family 2 protein n=1 Tax=Candidatus Nitrosarchaeum limnium TaxID=1007084 RepID=UPI001EE6604D